MFSTIRFALGVNKALHDAVNRDVIAGSKRAEMTRIAGEGYNGGFGRDLIKTGAARSRHSAAAMVFARIAGAAARNPYGPISVEDWKAASRQAALNAGATETESYMLVAEMMLNQGHIPAPDEQ